MKSRVLHEDGERTWAVVLEIGEEATGALLSFCREQGVKAARFTAIGAFREATLGFFDIEKRDYQRIDVRSQSEVLSLVGNVAVVEGSGDVKVHVHAVLGGADGSTCGGHLLEAWVRPTLEVVLIESPAHLRRRHDPQTGLALLDLG